MNLLWDALVYGYNYVKSLYLLLIAYDDDLPFIYPSNGTPTIGINFGTSVCDHRKATATAGGGMASVAAQENTGNFHECPNERKVLIRELWYFGLCFIDLPRLSLPLDHPASTSPFPSPGSPFFPPPTLGAHEFALRPPSVVAAHVLTRSTVTKKQDDEDHTATMTRPADGEATPTIGNPTIALSAASGITSPVTPTPDSIFQMKTPTTQITVPDLPSSAVDSHTTLTIIPHSNRSSLASSRPAPPSPALSRRTSAALSRRSSSAKLRRQSKAPQHEAEGSSSSVATVTASSQPKRRSLLFRIRDFAFPPSDERHVGRGPDVPRPNRPRFRWSTYSTASSSSSTSSHADCDEEGGGDERGDWGSFRWNTLSSHFSWGNGGDISNGAEEGGPSRTDFERNFDVSSPTDEFADPQDGAPSDDYEEDIPNEDEPLLPGLYRALYVFEPEGTAEMALREEQIVRVVGRGGGVGWAVVEKEEGGHALVPESYLELVEVDEGSGDQEKERA
ncbi:hypothetical protein A0H81_14604 [Grifola frondosa]|uniref:SH3 domain-containing protein n=1 Tax=Grifola frondosa TaxID=5627 RepID=A0A1C7LMF4_GRIFR|nr:hypothetical protein A0H81_14604 [Grifola frondosa]